MELAQQLKLKMFDIEKNTDKLLEILSASNILDKEFCHREKALREAEKMPGSAVSIISDRYYNLAHEIKSLAFLRSFGNVTMSEDSKHQAGCDYALNNHYQIECVCSTAGNTGKNGLDKSSLLKNLNGAPIDYAKQKRIIFLRLTSSIKSKLDFYHNGIKKGHIHSDKPYIIFLGLGPLAYELLDSDYGTEITGILLGKGNPTITIDVSCGKILETGYAYEPEVANHNKKMINCNIFCLPEYRDISGIIVSEAGLAEEYSHENTWLFINPFANHKITKKDFWGIVYWDGNAETGYSPRRKGRKINCLI